MAKRGKKSSAPTLPGLGGTLQFGGVQLKPIDTGKGGWGGFMQPKKGQSGRQPSFWDRDETKHNPRAKGDTTMAKRKGLPPRRKDGTFRKRRSGKRKK